MSRTHLHRRMKGIEGKLSRDFIRQIRLLEAKAMIENSITSYLIVAEIAYELGFSNPSHFTQTVKRQFGVNPSKVS